MILRVYAVRDLKAQAFMSPFFVPTIGVALRSFAEVANDPKSMIGKYPSDYELFEIGLYDDQLGRLSSYDSPEPKGLADQFIETPVNNISLSYNDSPKV